MFRIGDFSKISRVTIKTLRYYDKIGLLKPAFIDVNTGYRYYTEEQILKIHAILSYKKAGLSNAEINRLLSEPYAQKELLAVCKERLQKEVAELTDRISYIEKLLGRQEFVEYEVSVKNVSACKSYCCCGYVSDVSHIPAFIRNCHREIRSVDPTVRFPDPDYCCIIYPNDEYREKNIFVEYVQSVEEFGKGNEIVKRKELEAVHVVSVTHYGNYDTLSDAYLRAVEWAKKNGYVLRGDVRERYIHGMWDRENEKEWQTEVQLPILKEESK